MKAPPPPEPSSEGVAGWISTYHFEIAGAKVSLGALLVAIVVTVVGFFIASRLAKGIAWRDKDQEPGSFRGPARRRGGL